VFVARAGVNPMLMYSAMAFENAAKGLGTGAFMVLLLRMTQKRFSATQYALFSSLFALPRIVSGPISGFTVDAIGWEAFFWATLVAGVPGLVLLQRFAPLGTREPMFTVEEAHDRRRLTTGELVTRGCFGGAVGFVLGALCVAAMGALKAMRSEAGLGFDLMAAFARLMQPADVGGWLQIAGLLTFAVISGLITAAIFAARHGEAGEIARSASS